MADLRRLAEAALLPHQAAEIQPESLSDAGIEALDRFCRKATPDAILALYARLDALTERLRERAGENHAAWHTDHGFADCPEPSCVADRALLEGRNG